MGDWLYLTHPDFSDSPPVRIPNDEAVLKAQQARGWQVADEPEETPFVPRKVNVDPDDSTDTYGQTWVELVHPETEARHSFPANDAALQGAYEAGWVEPNKDGSIPKRATAARRRSASEQDAEAARGDAASASAPVSGTNSAGESTERSAAATGTEKE